MRAPRGAAPWWRRAGAVLLATLVVAILPAAGVASEPTTYPMREGPELFGVGSPLGRLDYRLGRGLRVGKTGLTIGGFASLEAERLEGGESRGGLEGVNFLVFLDPLPFLHLFSELEVGELATAETGRDGVHSSPEVDVNRLYADLGTTDLVNLRLGQFFTPIGRWNQTLAEPLLWTTSEPLIIDEVFDDTMSGAMLWGTAFPRGGALGCALYGTFLDQISSDPEAPPAKHSAGARVDWTALGGWSVGASYFAARRRGGEWNHLGGVDGLWRPHERVELSGEAVFGEGSRADGGQWGLYAQAVVETVATLYAVARYERYDPPASGRGVDLVDLGLTWVPAYYLRIKADYRIADHADDLSAPGLRASFSILF